MTQAVTGVQRYAMEIVRALDKLVHDGHPLMEGADVELLLPRNASELSGLQTIKQRYVGPADGHVWEQLSLPAHVRGGLISLCNVGPLAIDRQIVCMHDLNTRICPRSYALPFRALYRGLLPALARRSRIVTTVSHYSAAQLRTFGVVRRAPVVIPNGHEHVLRWRPEPNMAAVEQAGSKTIVLLGSAAPHKNARLILGLAPKLAELGLSIAVVGTSDPRVFEEIESLPGALNIRWFGRLSDDELAGLLQRSLCLAFPSYTEGFGLPPLEAMTIGCPVVVADRTSLPEICGDAALYAAPDAPQEWLSAFARLLQYPRLREQLIAAGRDRARQFSWLRSAELYLELMARIDGIVVKPNEAPECGLENVEERRLTPKVSAVSL